MVTFFVLFVGLGAATHLPAGTINPFTAANTEQLMKTSYHLAPGYTVIDDENRTLFIDYDHSLIHNLSKHLSSCSSFDLSVPEAQDSFAAAQEEIFAEVKIVEAGSKPAEMQNSLQAYTVLYAPRALLQRRVTEACLDRFGLRFVSEPVKFAVDKRRSDFADFAEMARQNTLGKTLNPLIYRLDLSHLLSRFGGLPVHSTGPGEAIEYSFSLEDETSLRLLQQKHCSSR
ncbi:hypothetical protein [Desulforhopalus sp. IMCC35007]|uniref:hypothetical protein n=1 Tax=Desulforhopalus sp. IMCC35007 TaxID=2569543 RepID=UPI0010AE7001|nr:hypothetical protein [Desulforhopalus sp. IMCC35007]TKB11581.1 hypothetical protein FCL48_01915 [Desulforhopalus sp. IMCC35007]